MTKNAIMTRPESLIGLGELELCFTPVFSSSGSLQQKILGFKGLVIDKGNLLSSRQTQDK